MLARPGRPFALPASQTLCLPNPPIPHPLPLLPSSSSIPQARRQHVCPELLVVGLLRLEKMLRLGVIHLCIAWLPSRPPLTPVPTHTSRPTHSAQQQQEHCPTSVLVFVRVPARGSRRPSPHHPLQESSTNGKPLSATVSTTLNQRACPAGSVFAIDR